MSGNEWGRKVWSRLDGHDADIRSVREIAEYPAASRKRDDALERAITRAGRFRVTVPLGALTARRIVTAVYAHTWDASYAAGGEPVGALDELVPNYVGFAAANGAGGITFVFDSATEKLLAYDAGGAEVIAATDMTALGTTVVTIYGELPDLRDVYEAEDGTTLLSARIRFRTAVTKDGTNYWTLGLRARAADETLGRTIGTTLSNRTRAFAANTDFTLYDDERGEPLADGDVLSTFMEAATQMTRTTGDATLVLDLQRKVV